jgi:hypothetical protein
VGRVRYVIQRRRRVAPALIVAGIVVVVLGLSSGGGRAVSLPPLPTSDQPTGVRPRAPGGLVHGRHQRLLRAPARSKRVAASNVDPQRLTLS